MKDELYEYFHNKNNNEIPNKMDETIEGCKQIMKIEKDRASFHMGFMGFLADTFHRDGLPLVGVQIVVLLAVCFIIRELRDIPNLLPVFAPLFILAALPSLFKAKIYRMSELEAATSLSNISLFLARLIIILLTDLFSFTILLALEAPHIKSVQTLFNMIIYVLVPYTFCISILLFQVRKKGSIGYRSCIFVIVLCSLFFWVTAVFLPILYNVSSIGLWIIFLTAFLFFMFKEIKEAVGSIKEGRIYGVIS